MFSALQTLSNAAYGVRSIPSPPASDRATIATSPMSTYNEDSIASTPHRSPSPSLRYLNVEQGSNLVLPPIEDLLPIKNLIGDIDQDAQSKDTPHLQSILDDITLHITTATDGWGHIDKQWPPLPQPNGWDQPSAKPYTVDDFPLLSPPPPLDSGSDADSEFSQYQEEDTNQRTTFQEDWPSIPATPLEGTDMRPPHKSICPERPGPDWRYNQFGDLLYHRFLIPDPNFPNRQLVAPYVRYNMDPAYPQISGTYGLNYPVTTRALRPTPVDYACPVLTAEQQRILRSDEIFAPIINYIVEEHCPPDLKAGIINYRYHDNARHALETRVKDLNDRAMQHLEKAMQALDFLEQANVLGRIVPHADEFDDHPKEYAQFFMCFNPFRGQVAYSAVNTRIDPSMTQLIALGPPESVRRTHIPIKPPAYTVQACKGPTVTANKPIQSKTYNINKRCHRCYRKGHIRRDCPLRTRKVAPIHY